MFKIIKSSSAGNCYIYKNIVIDCGIPYKDISSFNIKYLFLTHEHGDHINDSTIRNLVVNYDLQIICGDFLVPKLLKLAISEANIKVVKHNKVYKIDDFTISPVFVEHNVPNFGYRFLINNKQHIHITDAGHLNNITAKNYDSAMIEANYDEVKIEEIIANKVKNNEFCHHMKAKENHLSLQQAERFLQKNNIKKWQFCHQGGAI